MMNKTIDKYLKKIKNNFSDYFTKTYREQLEDFYKFIKEDNPVPSLDKTKIEKAFKKEFWNGQFVELHSGDYERIVEIILELQNGVETDKEEPKTLADLKLRLKITSEWSREGYTGYITFEEAGLKMDHPDLGEFAHVDPSEIEIIGS